MTFQADTFQNKIRLWLGSPGISSIYLREFLFEVSNNGILRGIKPFEVRWEDNGHVAWPVLWYIYSETVGYKVPYGLYGPEDALKWLLEGNEADITPVDVTNPHLSARVDQLKKAMGHEWIWWPDLPLTEDKTCVDLKAWMDQLQAMDD